MIWSVIVTFHAAGPEDARTIRALVQQELDATGRTFDVSDVAEVRPLVTDDDFTPPDLSDSPE